MSDKLTRKEIKHDIRDDEVQSFLLTAVEKVMERPGYYVGLVGAFFGVGLLAAGAAAYLDHRRDMANEKLGRAITVYDATIDADDPNPDDASAPSFASEDERLAAAKEALDEVDGGAAGAVAELYRADIALDAGDTATARKIWEDFVRDHGDHVVAVSVRLNLLALDRQEGKSAEVAERLQTQLDGVSKELPEDVLIFQLAQTREALGEDDAARELYQRLVDEYPQSPYTSDARRRVAG